MKIKRISVIIYQCGIYIFISPFLIFIMIYSHRTLVRKYLKFKIYFDCAEDEAEELAETGAMAAGFLNTP